MEIMEEKFTINFTPTEKELLETAIKTRIEKLSKYMNDYSILIDNTPLRIEKALQEILLEKIHATPEK